MPPAFRQHARTAPPSAVPITRPELAYLRACERVFHCSIEVLDRGGFASSLSNRIHKLERAVNRALSLRIRKQD